MNEQWQRLQRNVGNIFMQIVGKVLPYLNAILMVLNEIAKVIAGLFGYKLGDFDYFDEDTIGGVEDYGDALDSAADSAKKLKQGLRGFDKLNVITTPSDTGASGAGGTGGINPKLLNAFNDAFDLYNEKLANVKMKATEIRDKIMEWLGFTKVIDEETGEVSFKFDHITGGTVLGALAVGGTIYSGINKILKLLSRIGLIKFGSLGEMFKTFKDGKIVANVTKLSSGFTELASSLGMTAGSLAIVIASIVAIGAALIHAYQTSDEFRGKVSEMVSSVATLFQTLYGVISKGLQEMWIVVEPIWNAIKDTIGFIVEYCYNTIVFNFSNIIDVITGVAQIINDIINGDFDKAFDDLIEMVKKIWENFKKYFGKVFDKFVEWCGKMINHVIEFVPNMIEKLGGLLDWFKDLPNKFFHFVGEAIGKLWKAITETNWLELGGKILKGITDGLIDLIELGKKAAKWAKETFNKIKEEVGKIDWLKLGKSILDGIVKGMTSFGGKIKDWAGSFLDGIKDGLGIHSPSKLILDAKIGDFSMDAIALGMKREMPILKEQAKDIVDTLNSGIKEASIDTNFNYDLPNFNSSSILSGLQGTNNTNDNPFKTSINPTIIIQVGNKELAKQVITDLQDMAKDNGKPITITG